MNNSQKNGKDNENTKNGGVVRLRFRFVWIQAFKKLKENYI